MSICFRLYWDWMEIPALHWTVLRYIFTDRVRSTREGYVLTRVCLSVHTWGGTPARSRRGGGTWPGPGMGVPHLRYPPSDLAGGTPAGGYPTSGTPLSDLAGSTPAGVPHLRYPPSDLAGGTPARGYPTSGTSPCLTWLVGYPTSGTPIRPGWGYPTLGSPPVGGGEVGYPPVRPGWKVPLLGYPPCWRWGSGVPPVRPGWGVPHLGYPSVGSGWGRGYPCQGEGTSALGVPHLGYPPSQTWPGDTPAWGGTPWVLDTPRSVCLLRSLRRTFLYFNASTKVHW